MNRTMNLSIRTVLVLAIAALLAQSAAAATIRFTGVDGTTGADWRTTSVAKSAAFDPDGDNAYGSDGSFMFAGATSTALATVADLPSYISGVTVDSTINYQVNASSNAALDDASQPIGPTVADYAPSNWAFNTATSIGIFQNFFTVTLARDGAFLLDVITGTDGPTYYNGVHAIQVTSGGISVNTIGTAIPGSDGIADHTFFTLSGVQGDTFTVACMNAATSGVPATTGIAFESVPEPATAVLLLSGLVGLLAYAWRKRK